MVWNFRSCEAQVAPLHGAISAITLPPWDQSVCRFRPLLRKSSDPSPLTPQTSHTLSYPVINDQWERVLVQKPCNPATPPPRLDVSGLWMCRCRSFKLLTRFPVSATSAIKSPMKASRKFVLALLLACTPSLHAAAPVGKPQQITSPDQVPEGLAKSDWSSIRAAYEGGRYAAHRQENGTLVARNPGQQWRTEFDGKGFTSTPDAGGWTWGLELTSYGERRSLSASYPITQEGGNHVIEGNQLRQEEVFFDKILSFHADSSGGQLVPPNAYRMDARIATENNELLGNQKTVV